MEGTVEFTLDQNFGSVLTTVEEERDDRYLRVSHNKI
jgi:hypothetical protein